MNSFTASEAKVQFGELISQAMREPVSITKNGRPKVVVMSWEDYNEIEALKLRYLRAILTHSIAQAERGELHDIDDVFSELTPDELGKAGKNRG
jgi:prevent-host-death family protein